MPKRTKICFEELCGWNNLNRAFYLAAKGQRTKVSVLEFSRNYDRNIGRIQNALSSQSFVFDKLSCFNILDPKPRKISAPTFRDRIVHHAIHSMIEPILDRSMIDLSFACRIGKGSLKAVCKAQEYSRRFAFFAKFDVKKYFHSIAHAQLMQSLSRKIESEELFQLIDQLLSAYAERPSIGLPIGALTSQLFANFYLNTADRWLLYQPEVRGLTRYMDDTVCWFDSLENAKQMRDRLREFLDVHLQLTLKEPSVINRSSAGLPFCGYRIFPGTIKLSKRRQHRFLELRKKYELKFLRGEINAVELQAGCASALAVISQANSIAWRRLRRKSGLLDEV